MKRRAKTKYVHAGAYVAEVVVTPIEAVVFDAPDQAGAANAVAMAGLLPRFLAAFPEIQWVLIKGCERAGRFIRRFCRVTTRHFFGRNLVRPIGVLVRDANYLPA